ncbi:hypothetical protein [Methylobacterium gnaphalii]|uniref:Uncharacterized protein n=1 Tax=Methylobacterium gnaphalii TaxID=1010610 RepID=A0A512JNI0_9HYPH|nr:hypothetical protein [Methylobacterium gnaphalii]GEP11511.1 hypothetical protein MGN01_33560 [Methylobacterium gnaphalii]GJD70155.1 hypothetical protein MMMDOFMJ_3097 [Methylobacterium gnaphalii]GLS49515.1 hypothetical protein GCM10007885_23640 [Methylobacterium gnaphalii]
MADFAGYVPVLLEPLADRKKRWAQESVDAWTQHDEKLRARDEKTFRLKSLRLAKEAAEKAATAQAALVPKARAKRKRNLV